jgi:hypothetical protein
MRTTFLVLALVVCVSGCGESSHPLESNPEWNDINNVVNLVDDIDDENWADLFVEGSVPADPEPYREPIIGLPDVPKVTIRGGDTAEFEVVFLTEIDDIDGDGVNDEQVATAIWTAQKVGKKWKIKTAPLP